MSIQSLKSFRGAAWLGATACVIIVSPAFAQQAAPSMRYLSWVGKAEGASGPVPPRPEPVSNGRYPSIGSLGGRPSRYSPSVASGALTPASAWYAPQPSSPGLPAPAYAVQPRQEPPTGPAFAPPTFAPQPSPPQVYPQQPLIVPQTAMSAAPVYAQPNYSAQPMPGPHYQQQQRQLQQAQETPGPAWRQPDYVPQVYAPATPQPPQFQAPPPVQAQQQAYAPATVTGPGWASPQPVSAGAPVADPMAPRRDAPIFSINGARPPAASQPAASTQGAASNQDPGQGSGQGSAQPAPQQTASADGPPRSGPRYYSVHRAAGHQPDPTAMPESVYAVIPEGAFLDAARTDLAEPPPPPIQTRTINGRVQAINQGDNPSLP